MQRPQNRAFAVLFVFSVFQYHYVKEHFIKYRVYGIGLPSAHKICLISKSAHGLRVQKKQRFVSFLRKSWRKKDTSLEGEEQKKTQSKREGCSL